MQAFFPHNIDDSIIICTMPDTILLYLDVLQYYSTALRIGNLATPLSRIHSSILIHNIIQSLSIYYT